MAGLLKDEFVSEVMTELSWIMRVIDDLCLKGQHFIQYGGNKKRENTT